MVISQRLMRLFQSHQHFLLYVDVYAHRRASVRASVSEGFKGDPVSIGKLERFVADTARENGIKPKTAAEKKRNKRLLLSVQVLQDLHVPETLQSLAMM